MSALVTPIPDPGLLFGLMLLAALVGGHIARSIHVPRVIGFLLGGVALRAILYDLLAASNGDAVANALDVAAEPLEAIRDLALGLILFMIGGVFQRSRIRATAPRVARIGLLETGLTALFVFSGCFVATLLAQWQYGWGENLVMSMLLAAAAIATAPAATLLVLQEYEAKGPITETILGLTGANNIACIVVFYSVFLILVSCGAIRTSEMLAYHPLLSLVLTIFGSIVLGILCGALISICHAKLPLAETVLIFFALFILLGAGEKWLLERSGLSFNFLLTALVIGGIFANVAVDGERLLGALRTVSSPIFAGFFVMAGYNLHVHDLLEMGAVGGIYVLARYLGKSLGCIWGIKWAGAPQRARGRLGDALLCQAAVVIGLASFVKRNWDSDLAARFSTIILGSVVVFELVGPLLIKRRVVQGGEVKAVTLLSRSSAKSASIIRLTLRSVLRLFGVGRTTAPDDAEPMSVKHVMRTNVQFIPASATFDEVLHFIERSTDSHFPVVGDEGDFVGMIHFSDIRDVMYDPSLSDLVTAFDLADPQSPTVTTDMPLKDLLDEFTAHNVAVLPVAAESGSPSVIGVVEQRDLLRALHLTKDDR